jgi:hypothetical protein
MHFVWLLLLDKGFWVDFQDVVIWSDPNVDEARILALGGQNGSLLWNSLTLVDNHSSTTSTMSQTVTARKQQGEIYLDI